MRGHHHNAHEVTLLIAEVRKMTPMKLHQLHGITICPGTNLIFDDVSGQTFKTLLDWANSVYEDEESYGNERIGKNYGFDDDD